MISVSSFCFPVLHGSSIMIISMVIILIIVHPPTFVLNGSYMVHPPPSVVIFMDIVSSFNHHLLFIWCFMCSFVRSYTYLSPVTRYLWHVTSHFSLLAWLLDYFTANPAESFIRRIRIQKRPDSSIYILYWKTLTFDIDILYLKTLHDYALLLFIVLQWVAWPSLNKHLSWPWFFDTPKVHHPWGAQLQEMGGTAVIGQYSSPNYKVHVAK